MASDALISKYAKLIMEAPTGLVHQGDGDTCCACEQCIELAEFHLRAFVKELEAADAR